MDAACNLKNGVMELEGCVYKDGRFWLIEVPTLNLMTQGKSKQEALKMLSDAAMGLSECYFENNVEEDFTITVTEHEKGIIGSSSTNNKLLLTLSLKRLRVF